MIVEHLVLVSVCVAVAATVAIGAAVDTLRKRAGKGAEVVSHFENEVFHTTGVSPDIGNWTVSQAVGDPDTGRRLHVGDEHAENYSRSFGRIRVAGLLVPLLIILALRYFYGKAKHPGKTALWSVPKWRSHYLSCPSFLDC